MMRISGYSRPQDLPALKEVYGALDRVGLKCVGVSGNVDGCYTFKIEGPADEARSQEAIEKRRFPPLTVKEASGSFMAMAGHFQEVAVAPWMSGDERLGLLHDVVDGLSGQGYTNEVSTRSPPRLERLYIETHRLRHEDVRVRLAFLERRGNV